jgi:hypothetical protein
MEYNPYLQPGKHFRPQNQNSRPVPHKGNWSLYYGKTLLVYNSFYGTCVKGRKEWNRHKYYRDLQMFKIIPCVT